MQRLAPTHGQLEHLPITRGSGHTRERHNGRNSSRSPRPGRLHRASLLTIRKISPLAKASSLTPREAEVTRWLAEGYQVGEVAIIMEISMKTVEIHANNSMRKLDASNRAHLILAAIREGIVPCPCRACAEGPRQAMGKNRPMIATLDETKSAVGQAGTIQGLQAELNSVQAQLANSKDRERELSRPDRSDESTIRKRAALTPSKRARDGKSRNREPLESADRPLGIPASFVAREFDCASPG